MRYELYYWPSIQGRGEFVRLALEEAGADYVDVARGAEAQGASMSALLRLLDGETIPRPPFAPPFLRAGKLMIGQTANILLFLGARHGLAPSSEAGRLWAHQLQLTLADFVNDEPQMFRKLTWLDPREGTGDLNPGLPTYICKTVGGTTVHWTALAMRPLADEFAALSKYGSIDGLNLQDWPIPYDELTPWFAKAEYKMGVAGTNGWPYHPGSNNYKVLEAGARKLGYREIDMGHLAINSVARDGRPKCRQIGFCKSGCAIGAKWSTLYTEIPTAEATGHFELRAQSMVVRLNHDPGGSVTGVVYADKDGVLREQKARAVCIAANSIETPRLLLNSASSLYLLTSVLHS